MKKQLSLSSLRYGLPQEKIALYPANPRHGSKLLVYRNEKIEEDVFKNLSKHIPENALLVFNNSKVIPARLVFYKESGAKIEIFCLEKSVGANHHSPDEKKEVWQCLVGGVSKWKNGNLVTEQNGLTLNATLLQKENDAYLVQFSWNQEMPFYDVLETFGDVPLPPYLKRATKAEDKRNYQTVYSEPKGSVAAPTAGLHFTQEVFESLAKKKVECAYVTLHVGAGTFKPIKAENVYDHEMHHEWIDVSLGTLRALAKSGERVVIPVGTTSLRTIETLYWLGVKLLVNGEKNFKPELLQFEDWELEKKVRFENLSDHFSAKTAFENLLAYCEKNDLQRLVARTQIMITPDYNVRTANALLTNFHQPESSLLLLIGAFVGDKWKTIYDYAMQNNFRFLSYGDGSLLWL